MTIQELLNELKIDFLESGHHHCRPGWVQLRVCPYCGSNRYHLGINISGKFSACWRCGGHSLYWLLIELGSSKSLAWQFVTAGKVASAAIKHERTQIALKEPRGVGPLQPAHERYLRDRGFDPADLQRLWSIGGIGISSRLSWRIYIPIFQRWKKVSWTTRSIGDKIGQRYISAGIDESSVSVKNCVYGQDYCSHTIVVVEGPVDVWKIGPGAGALLGTTFTTAQVKKLAQIPRRFICFDSSKEAQSKARELCEQLACFAGETTNLVIDAKDPGEASLKELKRIRRAACLV
jgi:hypothetical protein